MAGSLAASSGAPLGGLSVEDHGVLETGEHVGGAAEQLQHARHVRVGHLRAT